jgi:hypothetical protein
MTEVWSLAEAKAFLLVSESGLAVGSTHPPMQWVPGIVSQEVKYGQGVVLTTHSLLRSRMSISYACFPPSASIACRGTAVLLQCYILRCKMLQSVNMLIFSVQGLIFAYWKHQHCCSQLFARINNLCSLNFIISGMNYQMFSTFGFRLKNV